MDTSARITELLVRVRDGDRLAADDLLHVVYRDLHARARVLMAAEPHECLLQPTALVNEAWLRIAGLPGIAATDRRHFLRLAARAMRNVLVDHARRRQALRRGGGERREMVAEDVPEHDPRATDDLIDLHEALQRLGSRDPELVTVVEMQSFGGLTLAEIAEAMGTSIAHVHRASTLARAWLRRELQRGLDEG